MALALWAGADAAAQDARPQARAVRVAEHAIRVDGRLDEAAWRDAPPVTAFTQREPVEGAPASDPIEVRIAYDDSALYVGARLTAGTPIQAPMGRRDEDAQAEHFRVSIDAYLDRRTAMSFGVTASGVRLDHYYASDAIRDDEATFTPVWVARTTRDADGWTAELRIPFSQLRFNARDPQVWGLNLERWTPSRNERVFWAPLGRTEQRWASRFGELHGLAGIRPRRRAEVLPYVAVGARVDGDAGADDPFGRGTDLDPRVGVEARLGLGSNLTLDATINPDFGQVEADPAEVNLTAFETIFDERRPFFTEGADLLTGRVNNYFYSRRIGAPPSGPVQADYVDRPATTTILGAAKLTGRLASGMSIGLLGAVTSEESARVSLGGNTRRVRVAVPTLYGVGRVEKEYGPAGSTWSLMGTAVHRALDDTDPLAAVQTQRAFSASGDTVVRLGDYEVRGFLGVSTVHGTARALQRLQEASARYYQRPDADYVEVDPTRTMLIGSKGGVSVERQQARHWVWNVSAQFETPGFETNDIGRLTSGDGWLLNAEVEYQERTPGRWFRDYSVSLEQSQEWNFGGARQVSWIETEARVTWPNYWETEARVRADFRRDDMRLTRGGPLMERPRAWEAGLELGTSEASPSRGSLAALYGRDEDGGLRTRGEAGITLQPRPAWRLSLTPSYEREVDTQQYVTTLAGGRAETFGRRYVFGQIDRSTYAAQVRLTYTFKPDLNLDFYGEPFAASGRYVRFGELAAAGRRVQLPVSGDRDGFRTPDDFRVRSFRSNLVLRWEWRAGSTLYLVWQQDRAEEEVTRARASGADLWRAFGGRGDHILAVKANVWIAR